jgi:hypothetical protein
MPGGPVSLTTVFDVGTRKNRSRYVMFRDLFSSSNVRTKKFISPETEGDTDLLSRKFA